MSAVILDRILRSIRVSETGCWVWLGKKDSHGYGQTKVDGKYKMVHRLMFEAKIETIPEGLCILHRCDNPPCCNPAHLFVGTYADNMADCKSKGRIACGKRNGRHTHPERTARGERNGRYTQPEQTARGERHGRAKMTKAQVESIRTEFAEGAIIASLAKKYGVNWMTIKCIVRRLTWK